ncbi:SulP family inorganic anion transporter [Celeribacter sp. PS-C1]|uniref:SulP family inorganic anion transporter n=1 Tax=Celeribacter sp. PS-C1 TaxID=2820813 RepID=UPI001CA58CFD|nr:SulP family inorganic anion transporter [Celeribacter sp. PS-C1]MBW6417618.1 STAS domain-containing protein [Celeribacter sp. PS-C1]
MTHTNRPQTVPTPSKQDAIVGAIVAIGVISILTVTFAIAAATLIYSGPLAPYANRGIGLALLGGIAMPIIAALLGSYRGVVCHLQEVPAIILSISAASLAASASSGETAFATVAVFVGLSSLVTGGILYLAGALRLGYLARFVPYSVIGGFLAATGLLLVLAALGMMTKSEMSLAHLGHLFHSGEAIKWLPWLGFAILLVVITRLISHPLVLPGLIVFGCAAFYGTLAVLGVDLDTARDLGLLLGPFSNSGFLDGLTPSIVFEADWAAIPRETGGMLTVAAMVGLGLLLNTNGIEMATGRDLDPERELKAVGVANVAAGATGGIVGYHLLGETALASRMGVTGLTAGLAAALSSALVLFLGAAPIASVPVGLIGAIVAYLGFDFLYEWLWSKRRKLPTSDRLIMLLIVALAGTVGFLTAFSVGLLLATVQFVVSYASINVVRLRSDAAYRRSSVERSPEDLAQLELKGDDVLIYDLTGYLFFGSANSLLDKLRREIEPPAHFRMVVLDFAQVKGLDTSAIFALSRISRVLDQNGIRLVLTGLSDRVRRQIVKAASFSETTQLRDTLDEILIEVENDILGPEKPGKDVDDILAELAKRHPHADISSFTKVIHLAPGDTLFLQGAQSKEMFQLVSGRLQAEIARRNAPPLVVARFLPGSIVGEIAYYAEIPRTASLLAETDTVLLRIDLDILSTKPDLAALASEFHRDAARHLAHRLTRMNRMLRDARF